MGVRLAKIRNWALIGCASAALVCGTAFADGAKLEFAIPAQDLASALTQFADQSDREILFSPEAAARKRATAVTGELLPEEALTRLLTGTGLTFRTTGANTILIENSTARAAPETTVQPTSSTPPADTANEQSEDEDSEGAERKVEKVTVTGSRIRGVRNPTAPVQTYDRKDIDKSGYSNTQQFIRSLPQTSSAGQSAATEDGVLSIGTYSQLNQDGASDVNLRGLGPSSTLTLLNGHRMSPSVFGSIVDISAIPISAIERVEVLTDGASAVYGTDAVAGVVNFILRKDYEGAETNLLYGGVTDGSLDERIIGQSFGTRWDSGGVLVAAQYHDRGPLHASERSFTADVLQPTDIIPPFVSYSGILSWNQQLLPELDSFGDVLVSRKNTRRLYSEGPVFGYDLLTDVDGQNLHGGIGYEPFGDWRIEASGTYSRQHSITSSASYTPPIFAPGAQIHNETFITTSGDLNADGTLFSLGGGDVKAAIGASYRVEDYSSLSIPFALYRASQRWVSAQFAELYLPLVDEANARPFLHKLAASAAIRRDDYSDVGETTNPKIGVLWSPVPGLDVRSSWGTSFRAPNPQEKIAAALEPTVATLFVTDPSGVGVVPILYVSSIPDPSLKPESSENWTVGFDYQPDFLSNVKLSVNYYDIEFSDRLLFPPFDPNLLTNPEVYGSLITPLADDAAAAAYVADFIARGGMFQDFTGTGTVGIRHVYNGYIQNAAKVNQSGFDVAGDYLIDMGESQIAVRVNASVIEEIVTAFSATSTPTDLVDTYGNPLHLRIRGDLTWSNDHWLINGAVNHSNAYRDTSAVPVGTVDAFTTIDLAVRFTPEGQGSNGILSGATFGLNVINLFDRDPPFAVGPPFSRAHYDIGNADPMGRYLSVEVRRKW